MTSLLSNLVNNVAGKRIHKINANMDLITKNGEHTIFYK